jgi:pimeloyl-ACP methyl ester carboxylesterase
MRLGSAATDAQISWWNQLHSASNPQVAAELTRAGGFVDLTDALKRITAPTLVITTDRNPIHALDWVVEWHRLLRNAELLVLPSDGYHVAAISPEDCAGQVHAFIQRNGRSPK